MKKNDKLTLYFILGMFGIGIVALIIALTATTIKVKKENKELSEYVSAISDSQAEEEKLETDKKKAASLVNEFITLYFLMDKDNYIESMEKIQSMVSDELYAQIKNEEFITPDYVTEIISMPVYELVNEEKKENYAYSCIISLQYSSGMKDYGIHMQIWDFTCGYSKGEFQILEMNQQQYVE